MKVAVVGAGIIGLLTALELNRRGHQVEVFHDQPHRNPASWAGGGILSPLFPWRYPEAMTLLTRNAVADYQALAAQLGADFEILPQGMRVITEEVEAVARWAEQFSVRCEPCENGWDFPELGSIRNPRLLAQLWQRLPSLGVALTHARVCQIKDGKAGLGLVLESGETIGADRVVVAAGAWSAELLLDWGVKLPVEPVKGQMLLWDLGAACPDTVLLTKQGYFIPRAGGLCLFGSTLERDADTPLPTEQAYLELCQRARSLMPPLRDREPLAIWAGYRPGNSRPLPYIFPVDAQQRLWVNSGHFRNGLVAAPASARLLAQWMCGEPLEFDPSPFAAP